MTNCEAMTALCQRFPTLRDADGVDPWDPLTLLRWLCTSPAVTGGGEVAARFVLSIWSEDDWHAVALEHGFVKPDSTYPRPFNVREAFGRWDNAHVQAFLSWINDPFFP